MYGSDVQTLVMILMYTHTEWVINVVAMEEEGGITLIKRPCDSMEAWMYSYLVLIMFMIIIKHDVQ